MSQQTTAADDALTADNLEVSDSQSFGVMSVHAFEKGEERAMCGHPSTTSHERIDAPTAAWNAIGCENCRRALAGRYVSASELYETARQLEEGDVVLVRPEDGDDFEAVVTKPADDLGAGHSDMRFVNLTTDPGRVSYLRDATEDYRLTARESGAVVEHSDVLGRLDDNPQRRVSQLEVVGSYDPLADEDAEARTALRQAAERVRAEHDRMAESTDSYEERLWNKNYASCVGDISYRLRDDSWPVAWSRQKVQSKLAALESAVDELPADPETREEREEQAKTRGALAGYQAAKRMLDEYAPDEADESGDESMTWDDGLEALRDRTGAIKVADRTDRSYPQLRNAAEGDVKVELVYETAEDAEEARKHFVDRMTVVEVPDRRYATGTDERRLLVSPQDIGYVAAVDGDDDDDESELFPGAKVTRHGTDRQGDPFVETAFVDSVAPFAPDGDYVVLYGRFEGQQSFATAEEWEASEWQPAATDDGYSGTVPERDGEYVASWLDSRRPLKDVQAHAAALADADVELAHEVLRFMRDRNAELQAERDHYLGDDDSDGGELVADGGRDTELPTLRQLAADGKAVGVAVTHPKFGTGEVRAADDDVGRVFVEFGEAGRDEWGDPAAFEVDWSYYAEYPDHATEAINEALQTAAEAEAAQYKDLVGEWVKAPEGVGRVTSVTAQFPQERAAGLSPAVTFELLDGGEELNEVDAVERVDPPLLEAGRSLRADLTSAGVELHECAEEFGGGYELRLLTSNRRLQPSTLQALASRGWSVEYLGKHSERAATHTWALYTGHDGQLTGDEEGDA